MPWRDERFNRIHLRGSAAGRADREHARDHPNAQGLRLWGEARGVTACLAGDAPPLEPHAFVEDTACALVEPLHITTGDARALREALRHIAPSEFVEERQ